MSKIVVIIFALLILLLLKCHIDNYKKTNNKKEILQVSNTTKTELENIVKERLPIIIYSFPESHTWKFKPNSLITPYETMISLTNDYPHTSSRKYDISNYLNRYPNIEMSLIDYQHLEQIDNRFKTQIHNYHSPLAYRYDDSISILNNKFKRKLTSTDVSRNIYVCLDGECQFFIYYSINKLPYVQNDSNRVSYYYRSHPKYQSYQYSKIIIRKNQGVIIPRYQWYTYHTSSNCILYHSKSIELVSLLSKFNII